MSKRPGRPTNKVRDKKVKDPLYLEGLEKEKEIQRNKEGKFVAKQTAAPLMPEEQAIVNRVSGAVDKDWETIGEDSAIDFSLMLSPFRLPPAAQKEQDEKHYAFRWIERKPTRVDEMRNKPVPFKWEICNRITTPFLKDFIDETLGCVCREDQILVYKPWWMHQREQDWKHQLADGKDRSGRIAARDGEFKDGVEFIASERDLDGKGYNHEIKGSDIVFGDAEDNTSQMREESYGEMADSDLIIEE